MLTLILAVAVAMGVSFLCSVMEAAILSINPGKLARLNKERPRIGAICREFRKDIEKPIAVILILNTTAHTFGAAIAGAQFDHLFGGRYIWLFSLVFTVLMVQYTEILPKTLGVRFCLFVMTWTAGILKYAVLLFSPLIWLVHLVNRPFEGGKADSGASGKEALDELDALATMARQEERITRVQEQAIQRIPDLHEDSVAEIMIPADRMVCLRPEMSRDEVLRIMRSQPHSRYPVRRADNRPGFDGMLEIRSLLTQPDAPWQTLIRPAAVIDRNCNQLHIAENLAALDSRLLLVRNEQGEIIGMLTIHNLLMYLFTGGQGNLKAG